MSLSNQTTTASPVKHYLRVKSGSVNYYDKEAGENVDVPVPLPMVVLDQLSTVKGWSDSDQSGYWSNEVRSAGNDALTVRTSKGTKATGVWKDIKNDPAVSGSKFNASVYVATKGREGYEISNIAFSGASLNAWIEFVNANKGVTTGKQKVVITGFSDEKKGAVKYQVPVFEAQDVTEEELNAAMDLDRELQGYLDGYFANRRGEEIVQAVAGDDAIDPNDIPF